MMTWLPPAAALLAVSLWAISFAAIKVALAEMSPESMIWLRQLLGALTAGMIVWVRGSWEKPASGDLSQFALAGFVGVVLHQSLQAYEMLLPQLRRSQRGFQRCPQCSWQLMA